MPPSIDQPKQTTNMIFLQVGALYGVIIVVCWLFSRVDPGINITFALSSPVAWAIIGWCQFAMFNALHEGLHNRFGAPHRNLACFALTAYPVGFDESYRRVHLDHHKFFGEPLRDPDFPNYSDFPRSKRAFVLRLFLNLCGWFALLQFLGLRQKPIRNDAGGGASKAPRHLIKVTLAQGILLVAFATTIGWFYYFWLWLAPLLTFGKFFTSTRTFCEHGSPDNRPVIRTITGSFLEEKLFGIFCFNYHAEHHHRVGIPYHLLDRAHSRLGSELQAVSNGSQVRYEHYDRGYVHLLLEWFTALPA